MRRLNTVSVVLASSLILGLTGCAADKSFEKEILGHPAPESPNDAGWARAPATPSPPPPQAPAHAPPPPPPPPAYAPPAPPPAPAYAPPPPAAPVPARPQAPANQAYAPKPFTPAPVAPESPATASPPAPPAAAAPPASAPAPAPQALPPAAAAPAAASAGDRAVFTFQVGNFAHAEKAKELMVALENKGFGARMEPGKLNNKTFYRVYAMKEGNRAELEGELLAVGVTEPRLAEERPAGSAPEPAKPAGKPAAKPASAAPAPAPTPTPSGVRYAPPVVEPAPPLPDGYVPPPKKSGS